MIWIRSIGEAKINAYRLPLFILLLAAIVCAGSLFIYPVGLLLIVEFILIFLDQYFFDLDQLTYRFTYGGLIFINTGYLLLAFIF